MKKKFVLILCVIMAVVFTMGFLGGCNKENEGEEDEAGWVTYNPYHISSVTISPGIITTRTLKKSFLYAEENRINISYKNENYDPNDPDSTEYVYDSTLPSERIILLTEQTQLEEAFEEIPEIDLETQMIVIVLFGVIGDTGVGFENIKSDNDVLEVIVTKTSCSFFTLPVLGGIVIKLDKMEITETKVTYKRIEK